MKRLLKEEIRIRLRPYSVMIFIVWPLFSMLMAAVEFRRIPYFQITWDIALLGAAAGTLLLIPDFLIFGVLSGAFGIALFASLSAHELLRNVKFFTLEVLLLLLSFVLGTSVFFSGILGLTSMSLFHGVSFAAAMSLLATIIVLVSFLLARPGAGHLVLSAILAGGILAPLAILVKAELPFRTMTKPPPLVLLGLDSLSQTDDLTPLRLWSAQRGGTWYSKPVPPGLLTNSVWTSLLTLRYVSDHGVFHVFQSIGPDNHQSGLISAAKARGYWTVAVFPDELTCWVGRDFEFDEDKSGALGWRQLATSFVSNASLVLPVMRPIFPRIPLSPAPPNQSGTFTYDLDRELGEIFTAYHPSKPVFVTAHTTYLHSSVYPRTFELTWAEWKKILTAPVGLLRDRALDWQDYDLPIDPIPLHKWKLQRLQQAIINSVERTQFFQRGGQLVLFSDHGDRKGMTRDNFTSEKYHRVLLVTFALPPKNPETPLSLLDVASILGLISEPVRFIPKVEYTVANPEQWAVLASSADLRFDGAIELNPSMLKNIFGTLRTSEPWSRPPAP